MVGYKLAKVSLFRSMYQLGFEQFIPFFSTVVGVLLTDLLKGIAIGIVFAIFYILRKNFRNNYTYSQIIEEGKPLHLIKLSEEVTFLNKASILELLDNLEPNSKVIIEGSHCKAIDHDAMEIIREFHDFGAKEKNIELQITGLNL
jgi:MFS superfamily sulfate permease-like transporter